MMTWWCRLCGLRLRTRSNMWSLKDRPHILVGGNTCDGALVPLIGLDVKGERDGSIGSDCGKADELSACGACSACLTRSVYPG